MTAQLSWLRVLAFALAASSIRASYVDDASEQLDGYLRRSAISEATLLGAAVAINVKNWTDSVNCTYVCRTPARNETLDKSPPPFPPPHTHARTHAHTHTSTTTTTPPPARAEPRSDHKRTGATTTKRRRALATVFVRSWLRPTHASALRDGRTTRQIVTRSRRSISSCASFSLGYASNVPPCRCIFAQLSHSCAAHFFCGVSTILMLVTADRLNVRVPWLDHPEVVFQQRRAKGQQRRAKGRRRRCGRER